jgi:hypothetical protein
MNAYAIALAHLPRFILYLSKPVNRFFWQLRKVVRRAVIHVPKQIEMMQENEV